ncbi:MAG: hypothetical protein E6H96_10715 [Chloroflexi bacterium]|nr:MAG: hypothetical protein E6H96_10715 [Chloroflexota bacterium]
MNVLNFGANSLYWRVRLTAAGPAGAPLDVVCYRDAAADPVAASDPGDVTVRWRDAPINRPEGAVLGAQYIAVLDHGTTRFNLTVTSAMPAALLAGTGWHPGTVLHNLLRGEGDLVYPGVGGVAIMEGAAVNQQEFPVTTSVAIRVSAAGARVFDAGTFAWGDGFGPSPIEMGVPASSFDLFNRNLLAWLGVSRPG